MPSQSKPVTEKVEVYYKDRRCARLEKVDDKNYKLEYYDDYLSSPDPRPVSLTLPTTQKYHYSREGLFPFFRGLLPEGQMLELYSKLLKIDPDNHFALLAATCRDCIGAVSVFPSDD